MLQVYSVHHQQMMSDFFINCVVQSDDDTVYTAFLFPNHIQDQFENMPDFISEK